MAAPSPGAVPQLRGTDLHHLHIFKVVVDCGGLSAAQVELNLSLSTISLHLSELEDRLSMRLCQRGRAGFALTPEGRIVYDAYARLGSALEDFRSEVGAARAELTGELSLAVVDNTVTDPNSPLVGAVRAFQDVASDARIRIQVLPPKDIERAVLDGQVHVGIGKFYHRLPELTYRTLYTETLGLYCGRGHPLFERPAAAIQVEDLAGLAYVSRGYVEEDEVPAGGMDVRPAATAYHIEGIAILVLSGWYLGYLPTHYAAPWVEHGAMRQLLPDDTSYPISFTAITRRSLEAPPVVRAFLEHLVPQASA